MGGSQSALTDISNNAPNELKCICCGELLTCLPITFYINRGNVCGRCPENLFSDGYPNAGLEALIKLQALPCKYKKNGCTAILYYNTNSNNEVKNHEENCYYRQYPCPTLHTQCTWKGKKNELRRHYENSHRALILQEDTFLSFSLQAALEENIFIFVVSRKPFLVQLRYDHELISLKCGLIYFDPAEEGKKYTFKITFKTEEDSFTRTITKSTVADIFVLNNENLQEIDFKQIDFLKKCKGLYYSIQIFEGNNEN